MVYPDEMEDEDVPPGVISPFPLTAADVDPSEMFSAAFNPMPPVLVLLDSKEGVIVAGENRSIRNPVPNNETFMQDSPFLLVRLMMDPEIHRNQLGSKRLDPLEPGGPKQTQSQRCNRRLDLSRPEVHRQIQTQRCTKRLNPSEKEGHKQTRTEQT